MGQAAHAAHGWVQFGGKYVTEHRVMGTLKEKAKTLTVRYI